MYLNNCKIKWLVVAENMSLYLVNNGPFNIRIVITFGDWRMRAFILWAQQFKSILDYYFKNVLALIIHSLNMRSIKENSTRYFSNLKKINAFLVPPVSNRTLSLYTNFEHPAYVGEHSKCWMLTDPTLQGSAHKDASQPILIYFSCASPRLWTPHWLAFQSWLSSPALQACAHTMATPRWRLLVPPSVQTPPIECWFPAPQWSLFWFVQSHCCFLFWISVAL